MSTSDEADIVVNGVPLSRAESMTIRVALEGFASDLHANLLGDDEHGRAMTAGYWASIEGIRRVLYRGRQPQPGVAMRIDRDKP
jgi:hypothetical protein